MGSLKHTQPTQPPVRQRAKYQARQTFKQLMVSLSWLMLGIIISAWLLDALIWQSNNIIVKSVALGVILNGITHLLFAGAVFRYTGYKDRRHIVNQLYLGQLIKWLLTITGFVLIFMMIKPLSAFALFCGYMIMQLSYGYLLWQIKR
ncbi:ATP synthase subunit I [Psychrobacter sp. I-STPA6b]|uniref:ATP synthase subunit I n=1 Tax=Psychrobacter sp. I-STPA6b TaxID=2585718 RepID=UPI001D0C4D97|nr:ATP synthase subunit I [Psychrobacter sp. I-STPA6b]